MFNFYAVIIGTEILNGRREDKHFRFVRDLLNSYGHNLFATFIIKDEKNFMTDIFLVFQLIYHKFYLFFPTMIKII